MSLKFAIFDVDGTLVDSRATIQDAMVRSFERCGLAPPSYDETRQIVGLDLSVACQRLAPEYEDLQALVTAYKQAFVELRAEPDHHEPLYDGALETLERLANENWLLGVATGKSRAGLEHILDHHPLRDYFDTLWCSDDGPGKPHPFMCEQAMAAVGAEPENSLIIGDAIFDMQMGRSAGIHTLGVSWGFGQPHELQEAGALEVHHSFETLNQSLKARQSEMLS